MKIARTIVAALVLLVGASACDAYPTAPNQQEPVIGSGTGTG